MKFIAHAGFRSDNGAVVYATLNGEGDWPCSRHMTDDGVKVREANPIEVTVDDDIPLGVAHHMTYKEAFKFLCALLNDVELPEVVIARAERKVETVRVTRNL